MAAAWLLPLAPGVVAVSLQAEVSAVLAAAEQAVPLAAWAVAAAAALPAVSVGVLVAVAQAELMLEISRAEARSRRLRSSSGRAS